MSDFSTVYCKRCGGDHYENTPECREGVIDKLRAEIERLKENGKKLVAYNTERFESQERMAAEIGELQNALKTYGKHLPSCTDVPLFCDCGLLKLINGTETTKDSCRSVGPSQALEVFPCKRLMLQEVPYEECLVSTGCDGCDCWRPSLYAERAREMGEIVNPTLHDHAPEPQPMFYGPTMIENRLSADGQLNLYEIDVKYQPGDVRRYGGNSDAASAVLSETEKDNGT